MGGKQHHSEEELKACEKVKLNNQKSCNCLEETEKQAFKFLKEALSSKYSIASFNEQEAGYTNVALMFTGPMPRRLFASYQLPYTPYVKGGMPGREKKHKTDVFFTFCPFCGKKYPE